MEAGGGIRKNDTVEFTEVFEGWQVGTRGRVISEGQTNATIEVQNNQRPGVRYVHVVVPHSKIAVVR